MKRIIHIMTCAIAFVLSWGMNAYAQDKVFFVPDPETARWSYLEMDADGAPVATMAYSVDSMKGDAVNGFVKLKIERLRAQSSETSDSFIYFKFKDGEFMVDMNAFFEGDALSSLIESAAGGEITGDSEAEKKKAIEEIKKHISIPVATIGGLSDPEQMEEIIASGKADIVEIARGLLADPDLPNKCRSGKEEEVTKIEVSVEYNAYYGTSTTEITYTLKGFKDQKKLKEKETFTSLKEVLQYLEDRFESSKVVKPL